MSKSWEPVGHLQGSPRPSGPETPKKSEKDLPGPPAPGPPRVWKKSGKSLEKVSKRSRENFFETLEAPVDFFLVFSGFRARRARETPVDGQQVPNQKGVPDTLGTLFGHSGAGPRRALETPRQTLSRAPRQTLPRTPRRTLPRTPPLFGNTLGDTLGTHWARRARETPVAGRGVLKDNLLFFPYNTPSPHPIRNPPVLARCPIRSVSARFGPIWSVLGRVLSVGWGQLGSGRGGSARENNITTLGREKGAFRPSCSQHFR